MKRSYPANRKEAGSSGYEDEYIRVLSPPYNPLDLLPDPLDSNLTTSPPPEQADSSPFFTGDDATHVENLVYWGIDSPVLPLNILGSLVATAEAAPALAPMPHGLPAIPTTSLGPTTPYTDQATPPPTRRGGSTPTVLPKDSQESPAGPSAPRPARRVGTSYPGQSSFRLDPTVPPLKQSKYPNRPSPDVHPDYPLCRCPRGPTKRPSRHWDVCPYNPEGRKRLFPCEICGRAFSSRWNKDRHLKSCPRSVS